MRMVRYANMLYPQYDHDFAKTIAPSTWEWLQEKAKANLAEHDEHASGNVIDHWRAIARGKVPFGYKVVDR